MIEQYFSDINAFKPLSREEERDLLIEAKSGNRAAYEKLINSNLKFVVSVAKAYQGQGVPLEDLISEGNIGLMKAYDRFDINKPVKFISYAVWWIRQSIINTIHENSKIVRLPLNKINNLSKARKAKAVLEDSLGREASNAELLNYIDDPEILKDLKFQFTVISFDTPHTDNKKDLTQILFKEEDFEKSLEDYEKEFKKELNMAIHGFSKREKKIIKMYFGIGYTRPYTLKEIGTEMELTRERIRQIKEKALEKLRKKHRNENLRLYL